MQVVIPSFRSWCPVGFLLSNSRLCLSVSEIHWTCWKFSWAHFAQSRKSEKIVNYLYPPAQNHGQPDTLAILGREDMEVLRSLMWCGPWGMRLPSKQGWLTCRLCFCGHFCAPPCPISPHPFCLLDFTYSSSSTFLYSPLTPICISSGWKRVSNKNFSPAINSIFFLSFYLNCREGRQFAVWRTVPSVINFLGVETLLM